MSQIKQLNASPSAGEKCKSDTATRGSHPPLAHLSKPPAKIPKTSSSEFTTNESTTNVSPSRIPAFVKKTRTLHFHGLHGWIPLWMEIDEMDSSRIPLHIYQRHFKHRPLHQPTAMEKSKLPNVVGYFCVCTKIGTFKIAFVHIFVKNDDSLPILGAELLSHFLSTSKSTTPLELAKKFVFGRGEKMGRVKSSVYQSDHHFLPRASWRKASQCPLCNNLAQN